MTAQTLLFIILAGIIALCVSVFQYFYKSSFDKKLKIFCASLRFLSLFALLLLLINPTFNELSYTLIKPVLAVAVDNSASIANLGKEEAVKVAVDQIARDPALNKRFDIDLYTFGESLKKLDSLTFNEARTDIFGPLDNFSSIYKQTYAPLLITDGNATLGRDYAYGATEIGVPIFALAVGDTLRHSDLSIERVNVNRYAYLDNELPVEMILKYNGEEPVASRLQVFSGNQVVYSQAVNFDKNEGGKVVNFFLPAKKVGINQFTARLKTLADEVNTLNNEKNFAVEVIDQKAKIALIYSYMHPDLGAYTKAIESNRLREVSLTAIQDFDAAAIADYDLVILFEPTSAFAKAYSALNKSNANRFTIVADATDYSFIDQVQNTFSKSTSGQSDEVQPRLNPNFFAFLTTDLDFSDFPPVVSSFGSVQINGDKDVLLYKTINGVITQEPLLAVTEIDGRREVIFTARDIWQWRAQSYINTGSFEAFDGFVDKLIQFSSSRKKRSRLEVDYESFYYGADNSFIRAQYLDKNYIFDPGARLVIIARNKNDGKARELPMILANNTYQVNLKPLEAGDYDFTVEVMAENLKSSGSFTIIPYDVERQAHDADWQQISAAVYGTGGSATTLDNLKTLVSQLLNDSRYTPVQKEMRKTVPLIDFKILLFIIAASLALEWFVRKYNGLI